MDPEAQRRAEALDRYWDEVVAGRSAPPPPGIDPATVVLLHLLGRETGLADAAFGARGVRRAPRATTEGDMDATTTTTTGFGPSWVRGWVRPRTADHAAQPAMLPLPGWSAAQFATAALMLVTLAAGVVAFDPGRPARRPDGPSGLPVAAAATPAAAASQVVEFLWETGGAPDMPLREPGPVGIDPAGALWIPDGVHDRFLIFSPDGQFVEAWGTPGSGEGEFEFSDAVYGGIGYGDVAFDEDGNVYVADTGNYRIQKFGPDRAFIAAWGEEGPGAGQFRRLSSIAVDRQGRVLASDGAWGKIEVFDPDGNWLETWSGLETPAGLAVAPDGSVLVADAGAGVLRLSPDGTRLATLGRYGSGDGEFLASVTPAVDAMGQIYVGDIGTDRVQVLAPDGTFLGGWGRRGDGPGEFHYPQGIAIGADGTVYVNDDAGDRLQAFQLLPPLAAEASPAP